MSWLAGRVALVTGGAIRLGRAMAEALAAAGARVAIHHHGSTAEADELVARLPGSIAVRADLRDLAATRRAFAEVAERCGPVDVLVNSASIFEPGDVRTTTEGAWDAHFAINLRAPFFLAQELARQHRPGVIINIADWRGTTPTGQYAAYSLTKAALVAMTRNLALELAPDIRVNAICPGAILPPPGHDATYLDALAPQIPLGHAGHPADVCRALLYLIEATFVTGEVLHVTGGQHLSRATEGR